jgi:Acetyltransferase (GNAT) domain
LPPFDGRSEDPLPDIESTLATEVLGSQKVKRNLVVRKTLSQDLGAKAKNSKDRVYIIDPLKDTRWNEFLARSSDASLFHSTEWLEALRGTYGYEPVAYTTSGPGQPLKNGLPICRIESWLTGCRLVSLPFSDYCAPLVCGDYDLQLLLEALRTECEMKRWRYVEMRSLDSLEASDPSFRPIASYTLHLLDLRPDLETLFNNLHKNSIQRKIKRAEREGLTYEEGYSEAALDAFYGLLAITRRRHRVPPQPRKWFRNLADCFGEALKIRLAFKDGKPVAGMLTIRYKETLVYKYGGSDTRFNSLGGMHLLYWRSIEDAKQCGLQVFDLGRSDAHQDGLITFKNRWGAAESRLTYCRFTAGDSAGHIFDPATTTWRTRSAKRLFARIPIKVLSALGSILYKHIG